MTNDEILVAVQGYIDKWKPLLGLENGWLDVGGLAL